MKKKILALCVTAAMVVTTLFGSAATVSAATTKWDAPKNPIAVDEETMTTAGHRAAQTLVEIVGLNNTACQNMAGNPDGITDGDADQLDPHKNVKPTGLFDTTQLAGENCKILGVFGSDLNSNPDPYYYNYFYNLYAENNGKAKVGMGDYILCINGKLSPNIADTKGESEYGNVSASVYLKPDILIGSSTQAGKGLEMKYDEYIKALRTGSIKKSVSDETKLTVEGDYSEYNPIVFAYKYVSVYEEGTSLQRLAKTMNGIETASGSVDTDKINSHVGTEGRYGNPMIAANDYMLYVKGLSAYVKKKIGNNEKTAVVIDACSDRDNNYKGIELGKSTGWFRAYDNTTVTGLAKKARGAECIENVTENLLQTYKNTSKVKTYDATDVTGKAYAISESVVKKADVIVLQGAQCDKVMDKAEFESYMIKTYGWTKKMLSKKTIIDTNPECVYGLTCNSSETALGYGFYMGYIYPEVLDPVDAVAYFYKKCMHVTSEKALQKFMNLNVKAAVANMEDPSTTLSEGWESTITADINEGVEYFNNISAAKQNEFAWMGADDADLGTIERSMFTSYDEGDVNSILYGTQGTPKDQKVKLAKSKVTVKGKKAATVKINASAKTPISYEVASYPSGAKSKISVSSTGKVKLAKTAKKGTYTVLVSAAASANYNAAKATFKIVKK